MTFGNYKIILVRNFNLINYPGKDMISSKWQIGKASQLGDNNVFKILIDFKGKIGFPAKAQGLVHNE